MLNITHHSGLIISKDTMMSELEDLPFVNSSSTLENYTWFHIQNFEYESVTLSVSLLYHNSKLNTIQLALVDEVLYGESWYDYSERKERKRARDMEKWLSSKGISNGSYDWGDVWIGFEGKTPFGGAIITLPPHSRRE